MHDPDTKTQLNKWWLQKIVFCNSRSVTNPLQVFNLKQRIQFNSLKFFNHHCLNDLSVFRQKQKAVMNWSHKLDIGLKPQFPTNTLNNEIGYTTAFLTAFLEVLECSAMYS